MNSQLTKVIEDFDRAVNAEALRLANDTSMLPLSQYIGSRSSGFGIERGERERIEQGQVEQEQVEQEFLFRRLEPVETGYHRDLRCPLYGRHTLVQLSKRKRNCAISCS
jgi:hypothetical protein